MDFLSHRTARVAIASFVVAGVAAIGLISPASSSAREAAQGKAVHGKSVAVVQQHGTAKPITRVVNVWEW